jgi:hypothetical protein
MRSRSRLIRTIGLVVFVALLLMIAPPVVRGEAEHVRWDIINIAFTTPNTISPGGFANAFARNPSTMKIKLTGSGTFVAPASGGESSAVTGGGTWQTFNCPTPATCVSTGAGAYSVTRLASWQFANFQPLGAVNDLIGLNTGNGANGNAVFRIEYSDGSEGTLGVGCHGPGAPNGIVEGVIATKDFVTYWDAEAPVAGVNADRTSFHIE